MRSLSRTTSITSNGRYRMAIVIVWLPRFARSLTGAETRRSTAVRLSSKDATRRHTFAVTADGYIWRGWSGTELWASEHSNFRGRTGKITVTLSSQVDHITRVREAHHREREAREETLQAVREAIAAGYHYPVVADVLGVTRQTLWRWLNRRVETGSNRRARAAVTAGPVTTSEVPDEAQEA